MAKDTKIILPRKDENGEYYISYSQLTTWKKSKRDYIRQYFFGDKFEGNSYTDFGGDIGEALENNDFSDFTAKERAFLETIPRYDQFERKIRLELDGFYVMGFIDTNTADFKHIMDYKTGDMGKESEYDNDKYYQLEIYAMGLEQETGILPETAKVTLIERTGNAFQGEELKLGNKFIQIDRSLDPFRLEYVKADVIKIAHEISDCYKTFLTLCGNE